MYVRSVVGGEENTTPFDETVIASDAAPRPLEREQDLADRRQLTENDFAKSYSRRRRCEPTILQHSTEERDTSRLC